MTGTDISPISGWGRRTLRLRRRLAPIVADHPPGGVARACDVDVGGHLVTEYVPQVTLADLLRMGPLPHEAALDALRDVAAELRAMWLERSEAHGDVKPWNVFVLPDGHATILDPAAHEGATRRGDAYWFAVLACELLTGVRPIERQDAARLMREAGIPEAARTAVLRALQPRPQHRPLPHHLVELLDKVPGGDWTGGHRPAPEPEEPVETVETEDEVEDLASVPFDVELVVVDELVVVELVAVEEPSVEADVEAEVEARPRRRRLPFLRRLGRVVALLGMLLVLGSAAFGVHLLGLLDTPAAESAAPTVTLKHVRLAVTPPRTHCPTAHLVLEAAVATNGVSGPLTFQWQLPGGTLVANRTVQMADGERAARVSAEVTVAGRVAVKGRATVTVSPGSIRATAPFRYDCGPGQGASRSTTQPEPSPERSRR